MNVVRPRTGAKIRALIGFSSALAGVGAGCIGAPTTDSAQCTDNADCGRCAYCANGACVVDVDLATCVDATEDPCDGVDNDGNGISDDPDVCWAPVWSFAGGDDARCLSLSPNAPPASCAAYTLAQRSPRFALFAHDTPGTRLVHQCSLGRDHVLVAETALFPDVPDSGLVATEAWQALGFDCSLALGWPFLAAPDLGGATTPFGPPTALARVVVPLDPGGHRYGAALGDEAPPIGARCEPDATLWVFSSSAAAALTPAAACGLAACPPRAAGVVERQTPADGTVVHPPAFDVTWRLKNTGDLPWSAGWLFVRLEGHWSNTAVMELTEDVAIQDAADLAISVTPPTSGVDLVERWALLDDEQVPVVETAIRFSVATDDAAALTSLSPEPEARFTPGATIPIRIEIENTGATPWSEFHGVVHRSGDLLADEKHHFAPIGPGERQVVQLFAQAPAAPGRYVDSWSVRTGGAADIPITTSAGVSGTFDTVIDVIDGGEEAMVRAAAVTAPITLRPLTPFFQAYWIENIGQTSWAPGWSLRHVSGALSRVDGAGPGGALGVGQRALVVIPMRAPEGRADHLVWRDGWDLLNAEHEVIGLWREAADGTRSYGADHGAWLWTEVTVGEPCAAPDATR